MKTLIFTLCFILVAPVFVRADFLLGVGTHIYEQNSDKVVNIIKSIGLNSLRDDFRWSLVEKEKGKLIIPQKLDQYLGNALGSKIESLMIFDYGNRFYDGGKKPTSLEGISAFARFSAFSAKQLKGQVKWFEIWNEWDSSADKPVTADSYFELLKSVAPAIKENNYEAIVLAGTVSPTGMLNGWAERLVYLGVLEYIDGISIHPYFHCEKDNRPEAWIYFVREFSKRLNKANGGKVVPLYITEMGWPSNKGACGTPPEKVAQYLARALLLVRTVPEIKGFWWYDLRNDGKNIEEREHNFGLLDYNYVPKPAYYSLRDIAPLILNGQSFTKLQAPSGLEIIEIIDQQQNKSYAIWSGHDNEIRVLISVKPIKGVSHSIRRIGTNKSGGGNSLTINATPVAVTARNNLIIGETAHSQEPSQFYFKNNSIELSIDGTPQILSGVQSFQIKKVTW